MSTNTPTTVTIDPYDRGESHAGEVVGTRMRRDSPYPELLVEIGSTRFSVAHDEVTDEY